MTHQFDIEIAKEYGVVEAVVINHLQFWITKNKANDLHQHDGRTWTYNSMKAFGELFPYLSAQSIRTTLKHLTDREVILTGNYNETTYHRTLWYAFKDEEKWLGKNQQMHLLESTNGIVKINKPIPYNIPDNINNNNTPSINNNSSNNNISEEVEKAVERIVGWLTEDYDIRRLQFFREGLINENTTAKEVLNIIRGEAEEFYEQCRLDGRGDIERRGRTEVISHFNNWLKKKVNNNKERKESINARTEQEFLKMLGCKTGN